MFESLAGELAGFDEFADATWSGASDGAPDRLVGASLRGRPALFVAVWDRGSAREINIVPAESADQLPPTLIGAWKMRDGSLSSTGTVTAFPVSS